MLYSSASIWDILGGRLVFDGNCFLWFHSKIPCQYCYLLYLIPEETKISPRHAQNIRPCIFRSKYHRSDRRIVELFMPFKASGAL